MMELLVLVTVLALKATLLPFAGAGTAPKIEQAGTLIKALPDKMAYMSCDAIGEPTPTITWERDGKPISEFGDRFSINMESNALRIFTLEVGDRGQYTCQAENTYGVARVTNILIVMIQPEPKIVSPTNLTFPELTNQELVCRSQGLPRPLFEWLTNHHQRIRANRTVDDSNSGRRMYSVERQVGEEVYESILIFQPITFKDYGSVACVAYNDIGSSRTTVALDVVFPPKVLSQHAFPQPVSWWVGHSANLTCAVMGNDLPAITWSKDGRPFKCNNLEESVDGAEIVSSCVIKHTSDGGAGVYRCSAENSLGKILVHEFRVTEKFAPPPAEFTVIGSKPDEVTLLVKVPTKENTPPAIYVLASYQLASEGVDGKRRPVYERMGDVNDKGEAIVKLVGVKINSDYLVTMRARNSVGMGPESTGIVNTAITSTTTSRATTTKNLSVDKGYVHVDYSGVDVLRDDDGMLEDEFQDDSFDDGRNGRVGQALMGPYSHAVAVYSRTGLSLQLYLVIVCFSAVFLGRIML